MRSRNYDQSRATKDATEWDPGEEQRGIHDEAERIDEEERKVL
jgi:hypothetical protein